MEREAHLSRFTCLLTESAKAQQPQRSISNHYLLNNAQVRQSHAT